ncbi:MAG: hypothetical protein QW666_00620 [Candidatus Woesearchaeota archaeon]
MNLLHLWQVVGLRYDYSLDVGQSMKSEEELKAQQEKENQQVSGEELSAKKIEEEIKQEAEKEAQEPKASDENTEEAPGSSEENAEAEDDLTVKEISFEKAQLIEEHEKAQKTIDEYKKAESEDSEPEEQEGPKDELEQDVSEIIEDSYKEPERYINNNNSNIQEYLPEPRGYAIPVALVVIFIAAVIFGFVYFMYPGETTTAVTVSTLGEEIALEPAKETPPEMPVAVENATAPIKNISKTKAAAKKNVTKKTAAVQKSDKELLSDILFSGLN